MNCCGFSLKTCMHAQEWQNASHNSFFLFQDDCSQATLVTSHSSVPEKQTAIIIAEEKGEETYRK